jgi:kynurenine formamidase
MNVISFSGIDRRMTALIVAAAAGIGALTVASDLLPSTSAALQSKAADDALTSSLATLGPDRVVDMSYAFDEKTIYWPTDKPFRWEKNAWGPSKNGYWYASANYAASEHGGTHLDSPVHFAEKGDTTEKIGLDRLIGPAAVVDVSSQAIKNSDYLVSATDIDRWEAANGPIPEGTILVIRTGWGKRWPDKKAYLGTAEPGDVAHLSFPGIGADAAKAIVARKVKGVAIDTASLDRGVSKDFQAHRILNAANIYGIENLANAERLPARGAVLIALPMKIAGGSGGPVRVMAILPNR